MVRPGGLQKTNQKMPSITRVKPGTSQMCHRSARTEARVTRLIQPSVHLLQGTYQAPSLPAIRVCEAANLIQARGQCECHAEEKDVPEGIVRGARYRRAQPECPPQIAAAQPPQKQLCRPMLRPCRDGKKPARLPSWTQNNLVKFNFVFHVFVVCTRLLSAAPLH